MPYTKQTWADHETPLDAEHLNHMEQGIAPGAAVADVAQDADAAALAATLNALLASLRASGVLAE